MLHVAILIHRHDPYDKRRYWLKPIAECWRESGIRTSLVRDPRQFVAADIAILHVDLTKVPQGYLALAARYPVTLNSGVLDIAKRKISTDVLQRGDPYEGPVIVKSDRNSGGFPEAQLGRRSLWPPRRPLDDYSLVLAERYRALRRRMRGRPPAPFLDYRLFTSPNEVPEAVWNDPELIVERFLAEKRDKFYCVRTWLFLGDRERSTLFYSPDPIIKSRNIVGHEVLDGVPDELRQRREELKFDYGKFDYAVVDGRVVLYDANRTPTIGDFPAERYLPVVQTLAAGIKAFQ